ncbi:MAG: carboxyl-terminal processing protease [Pyrinomonadaceae bacterium]|nr:carboxyl-terminal processing protease [Pyrinomonadaceae bacterium]
MKQKISSALVALLLVALSLPSFVIAQQQPAPGRTGAPGQQQQLPPNVAPSNPAARRPRPRVPAASGATAAIEEDFAEALSIVQENYVDGVKIDYNSAFKSSIIGMLRSLDPHSNYYDSKEFEELQADWRSEYYGIGATIGDRTIAGQTDTYILATFPGAPATRAGLRFADRIIEVNGETIKGKSSSDVRDRLRGPKGSTVKVTVERASSKALETVEITRDAVGQPTIPDSYLLKPGVGYIDMTRGFNRSTAEEFIAALEDLRKQGMTSLVLDLRGNPGGLLDQAVKVAERFLQRGQVILSQKGRVAGSDRTYESRNTTPDNVPLVVLVNRNSASASEIVAGALQDHDRALIIGETSFGKGLVQSIIPLEYGTAVTLTSSKYYTPSGRLIQRDYTNEGLYDYYTRGGVGSLDDEAKAAAAKPAGPESLTDTGRKVYGGGGISPDEPIKPRVIEPAQQRMIDPIFGFVRELVNGRIKGFEDYKIARGIDYEHDVKADEYPVTDNLFKAFKAYVASDETFKLKDAQIDRSRDFIARQMRYDIATAAYGTVTASQVQVADDPQVAKAIEVLPRAKELSVAAMRGRNPERKTFE